MQEKNLFPFQEEANVRPVMQLKKTTVVPSQCMGLRFTVFFFSENTKEKIDERSTIFSFVMKFNFENA